MSKILIIDDDLDLLKLLNRALKKEHDLELVNDAVKLDPNSLQTFDLIILDIMMPNITGFEFLRKYRELTDVPILLLTAKDFDKDKVEGFALGADDYITKPFSIEELRARVYAHLRREKRQKHSRLADYPVSCDFLSKEFFVNDTKIDLTAGEYEVCEFLLKNKGQVFSKEHIYTSIYGYEADGNSNTTIRERIKLIRTKFNDFNINPIKTIWGVGYKWEIENL